MCGGGIVLLFLQLGWPAMADYSIPTDDFDDNDYADGVMHDTNDEEELAYTSRIISMSKRVKKKTFDIIRWVPFLSYRVLMVPH